MLASVAQIDVIVHVPGRIGSATRNCVYTASEEEDCDCVRKFSATATFDVYEYDRISATVSFGV